MNFPRLGLGTFRGRSGGTYTGLLAEGRVLELSTVELPGTLLDLLDRWDGIRTRLPGLAELAGQRGVPVDELHVLAPWLPRQVFQSGANYRHHVIDLVVAHRRADDPRSEQQVRADAAVMMDSRAAEGTPYLFVGLPSAVAGPYDDLVLPSVGEQHDWELELAAVIGRPAFRVSRAEALEYVAGYTIGNDITTRDLVFRRDMPEIGTDWYRSKNAPGFLPLGPFFVPADVVADPMDLRLTLRLNGEVMQNESTKDMIFDVAALVAAASQTARLLAGDIILTGSPAGNGLALGRLLRPGDVMEGTISSLGTQRVRCLADEVDR
jgi:2,4-didehydro-3-deoxy-L-rhamnonate hydrolase